MTLQFLPAYFKKIGIALFVITGIPSFTLGFKDGFNGTTMVDPFESLRIFGITITEPLYTTLGIIGTAGLIIYLLSKDKIMDEYTRKIRLETFRLVFLGTAALFFIGTLINPDFEIDGQYLLEYQLVFFIVINGFRKRYIP